MRTDSGKKDIEPICGRDFDLPFILGGKPHIALQNFVEILGLPNQMVTVIIGAVFAFGIVHTKSKAAKPAMPQLSPVFVDIPRLKDSDDGKETVLSHRQ
ncbi:MULTISPECIES: hypothetical protein [Falsihalocynthiibacter]|uniref:hypothetical protein n=1 Tax=Falsihalocynthiibacter TaxID=2854182 RepID=UPI0030026E24